MSLVLYVYWFVLPVPLPLDTTIGAVDRVELCFVLCSFELRVLNVAVKSLLDLFRFCVTFRARASRDAINDGRADVSQLHVGVFFFEYIVFLLNSFVKLM